MPGTLSVLMRLKADPEQAERALESFKGHVSSVTSAVEGDFSKLSSRISGMMGAIGPEVGLAAGGITALGGALLETANKAAEFGGKIYEASEITGMSAAALSGAAAVSKEYGENYDDMVMGIGRASRNLAMAIAEPTEETSKILATVLGGTKNLVALGLKPADQQMQIVLKRIFAMNNLNERNLALSELFGRSWMSNVETLKYLAENGFGPAIAQAKKFGMYYDADSARRAKMFQVQMETLRATLSALALTIGKAVIPMFSGLMQNLSGWIPQIEDYADRIKAVALAMTGQVAASTRAWEDAKKHAQEALQAQTDYLVHLDETVKAQEDAAKSQGKMDLDLSRTTAGHSGASRAAREHAMAIRQENEWQKSYNRTLEHTERLSARIAQEQAKAHEDLGRKLEAAQKPTTSEYAGFASAQAPMIAAINAQIAAQARLTAAQQAALPTEREISIVKEKLAHLYPMLTNAQLKDAATTEARAAGIKREIALYGQQADITKKLTNYMREKYNVQEISTRQQLTFNQAVMMGNQGIFAGAAGIAQATAGILETLKLKKAYAVVMTVYEAAKGFEDLADYNFWGAAQAFASSAMYAKVAGTHTPKSSGSAGGGGGSRSSGGGGGRSGVGGPASLVAAGGSSSGGGGTHTIVNVQGMISPDTMAKVMPQIAAGLNQGTQAGSITLASSSSTAIPAPKA